MASRFVLPFADIGNGIQPEDGAQLFFFQTGTSTPKDTYSDAAATTPNANPVIADSNGLFSDIFITGNYKVQLKDKNDVQIWEADPVSEFAKVTDTGFTKNFATLSLASASTTLEDGDALNIKERTTGNSGGGVWDVVLAASVSINTFNIVASTGSPTLALVLRIGQFVDANAFGVGQTGVDDSDAWQSAADYSWANRSTISTASPTPLADYSVLPVRIAKGEYTFTSTVTYEPAVIWIGDEVQINPAAGTFAFTPAQSSSGYRFYVEGITINGESGWDLNNNNIDVGRLKFERCKFFGCVTAVRTKCQSSSVIFEDCTWYQCDKSLNILSGDLVLIKGGWMKQFEPVANFDATIENNGKLVMMDIIGVPNNAAGFTETAWINNRRDVAVETGGGRTGYVELYHTRFGGETGSKTIVNNFASANTGSSPTPTAVIINGCDVYSVDGTTGTTKGIVRLFSQPANLSMTNNSGFTDTHALALGSTNTVATEISGNEQFYSVVLDNGKMPPFGGFENPANNMLPELWEIEAVSKQMVQSGFSSDFDESISGWAFVSTHSAANSVANLPSAVPGLEYTAFRTDATFQYRFVPQPADTIRGGGVGKQLRIDTQYVGATLHCYVAGFWEIKEAINSTIGSADFAFEP